MNAVAETTMDVLNAIETRVSAVRLAAPAPLPEHLSCILYAGTRAPDHGKLAPWRFVVFEEESRQVMSEALAGFVKRQQPDASEAVLDTERSKAMRAPMIVTVVTRLVRGHKVPEIEQILAVGAAVQNMLLAAHALGYGAMWKTGAAAYDAQVKIDLGLEPDDHIVAFLYLGTVAAAGKPRKTSLEGVVQRR